MITFPSAVISSDLRFLIACPGCDLLMPNMSAGEGDILACPRCGTALHRYKKDSINRTVAHCLVGLFLYFPAMLLPLMTFQTLGMSETANIVQSIITYYRQEYFLVALMVFFSAVLFPFLKLSLGLIVALLIKMRKFPAFLPRLFRFYIHLEDWAMVEVYLLGIMVTVIKMYDTTDISYGLGFYCFIALVLATLGTTDVLDKRLFWDLMEGHGEQLEPDTENTGILNWGSETVTAMEAGLISCHTCNRLTILPESGRDSSIHCPLCGARLHSRKPDSIARTWALMLTAGLLFIPANFLPIMRVDYLGRPDASTIIDGILHFFRDGSYAVGLIILSASILVPLFKISGLLIILLTIRSKRGIFLQQQAKMFRFIEFIGRWSMLDIFVIAILSVLVRFGFFSSIQAAPAATYFCMVVITTMLAAHTFDPRLLWDTCCEKEHEFQEISSVNP
jgi:paraquat-inducible protein A